MIETLLLVSQMYVLYTIYDRCVNRCHQLSLTLCSPRRTALILKQKKIKPDVLQQARDEGYDAWTS